MTTHRERFLKKHNLDAKKHYSIKELSQISGTPVSILTEVHSRGLGAYHTQYSSVRTKGTFIKGTNAPPSMKLSPSQWAFARIYSYLDHNPKHDTDLRKKEREMKK